jgi:hypothetical protein
MVMVEAPEQRGVTHLGMEEVAVALEDIPKAVAGEEAVHLLPQIEVVEVVAALAYLVLEQVVLEELEELVKMV